MEHIGRIPEGEVVENDEIQAQNFHQIKAHNAFFCGADFHRIPPVSVSLFAYYHICGIKSIDSPDLAPGTADFGGK